MTAHALQRLLQREPEAATIPRLWERLEELGSDGGGHAVRLLALDGERGARDGAHASNGDELWAIVRDGRPVTIMRRRREQPATPEALRVDAVHHFLPLEPP